MRTGIVLSMGLLAVAAQASSLSEALDRAWQRHPQAQALEARRQAVAAKADLAGGLLAGPPTAGVSFQTDQLNEDQGRREWEAEVEMPLWYPGERKARQTLAERETAELDAETHALRLELAGQLREAVWAVTLADAEYRLARERETATRALADDVARRVKAGELARTDQLLARDEVLIAQHGVLEKAAEANVARRAYEALTGAKEPPTAAEETVADEAAPHPRLTASATAAAVTEAKVRVAARELDERPQLILSAKRERPEYGADDENSLRIGIKVPLGGDRFSKPHVAAAQAELDTAATAQARTDERIALDIETARAALETENQRLALAHEKHALATEHFSLARREFELGFSDLPALLRVRAIAVAADIELTRQQILVARARARLNQALGVLP